MSSPRVGRHAERVHSALSAEVPSALMASWRRSSALHGLDPEERKPPRMLAATELLAARQRIEPLIRAACASLDRLYLAVGGIGCCVLMADRDGVPVDRRGAVADDTTFRRWGLWTGAVWSEASEGTNGIGTCLVEQRPLTIHRDQHFHARNVALSCTVAPIYDHEGRLAAALDVSSCRADLTEAYANLIAMAVSDAARRVEAENFRQAFSNARILLTPNLDRASGGLLAVDQDDLVVGATRSARLALGITDQQLLNSLPAADVLGDGHALSEDLTDAPRRTIQRALARTDGNVLAAATALGISRATLHRKMKRLGIGRSH